MLLLLYIDLLTLKAKKGWEKLSKEQFEQESTFIWSSVFNQLKNIYGICKNKLRPKNIMQEGVYVCACICVITPYKHNYCKIILNEY